MPLPTVTPISLLSGDEPILLYDDPAVGGDGSFSINPSKEDVKWQWSTVQSAGATFPVTLTANQSLDCTLTTGAIQGLRGDTEYASFMITRTGRVNVLPYIASGINKQLASCPIPDTLMFGTSQLPGWLPMTLYCLPKTSWTMTLQDASALSNTVSMVAWGRRYYNRNKSMDDARKRALSQFMHAYWLGPFQGFGTAITMGVGSVTATTTTLEYRVPTSADFLCRWIYDDSTSTSALEPLLTCQIVEGNGGGPNLTDQTNGLSFRDFMAIPANPISTGLNVRAASLPGPGCYTHLFKRGTTVLLNFRSTDTGTITLRPVLVGYLVYANEALDRYSTADTDARREREAQAAAMGASPAGPMVRGGARGQNDGRYPPDGRF